MKTLHLAIIILIISLTMAISSVYTQYGLGFSPPVHYPSTNDTKLELVVMNSTEFKERTTSYNYTLVGIDYSWIPKGNNYYDFGGARVTFLVWGFGNATTKGEAFNLDSQMKIKSVFEYDADRPPGGYPSGTCEGMCVPWVNPAKSLDEPKTAESPLKQFQSSDAINVKCKDGLVLVIKAVDGSPACVSPATSTELILWKWALPFVLNSTKAAAIHSSGGCAYPIGNCMGSFGPPVNLPQKFDMSYYSKQGAITIFSHSFSLRLDHGDKISYRINATSPINFVFSFSNNTRFQYSYGEFHNWGHPQENIFELKNVTSYARNFTVSKTGVYIYEFSVDNPEPISTVSFDAIRQ